MSTTRSTGLHNNKKHTKYKCEQIHIREIPEEI